MEAPNSRTCFTVTWKILLAEFNVAHEKKLVKYVFTTFNNVVFHFRLEWRFHSFKDNEEVIDYLPRFVVVYESGPLALLDVKFTLCICKDDYTMYYDWHPRPNCDLKRECITHYCNLDSSPKLDKAVRDLQNASFDSINEIVYCTINIQIPRSAFNYRLEKKNFEASPDWLSSLYADLEDAETSKFSDVQLVSGDGRKLYCHRVVIGKQSKELATMFQNPKSEKEQSGEFTFPKLDGKALNAILQYLYTGECFIDQLPTPSIIQVADFGEQYDLKDIKAECTAVLWKRVVERPEHAIDILRFADLHDQTYLKDRALDVLQENFERLSLQLDDFSKENEGDLQGKHLQAEFNLFTLRRVSVVRFEE